MPVMASSGAVTTKRVKRCQTKWHSYRLVALEHNQALGLVTETWKRQADLEPQLGPLELCDADGGDDPDLLPADAAAQEAPKSGAAAGPGAARRAALQSQKRKGRLRSQSRRPRRAQLRAARRPRRSGLQRSRASSESQTLTGHGGGKEQSTAEQETNSKRPAGSLGLSARLFGPQR